VLLVFKHLSPNISFEKLTYNCHKPMVGISKHNTSKTAVTHVLFTALTLEH
jgi:hypothetical protein